MHIDMNGTNDCRRYIDKLANIGTNYSRGRLILSASAGGYANTNYYLDDTRNIDYRSYSFGLAASNRLVELGASPASLSYLDRPNDQTLTGHITNAINVAAFFSYGVHGYYGDTNADYAINTNIVFSGSSSWYLINTVESFNGTRYRISQGLFVKWFSSNAFGGTNYSNTPVGAISYSDEPGYSYVNRPDSFFGMWHIKKNFGMCAWQTILQPCVHAVGDPLVIK